MEEAGARHFLVMELVDGETLAERIARGPMAVESALTIVRQILEALEAAHEQGIVHRDLKPANVKITPDEKVKVLDFGLAKALVPESGSAPPGASLTHSPTLSMMATQAGVILGTAAYMSPEQAKGMPADHRSDVFSVGVVLYEMLTGRQPFQGETAPDILASVLARDADLSALPPFLNPRLPELIRRCLEKSPKKRWQAVGDLRVEIEAIAFSPRALPAAPRVRVERPPLWRRAIPVALAIILTSAASAAVAWRLRPTAKPQPIARFALTLPEGQEFSNTGRHVLELSPNGTQLVYVANQRLYLRSIDELEARPISGVEPSGGVSDPAFSPDGQFVAFSNVADQTIKKVPVRGGLAITITAATLSYGLSWDQEGILFGQNAGVMRAPATGGKAEVLVPVDNDQIAQSPHMLPGGQAVLFTLVAAGNALDRWDRAKVVVQSLQSGQRKVLIEGGTDARYLATGHIVYASSGTLLAVPFDVQRMEIAGSPMPILEGVRRANTNTSGTAQFAVSDTGTLAYVPGPASISYVQRDLGRLDRKGQVEPLNLPPGSYDFPRISPDGDRVVFAAEDGKEAIVWVYELSGASSMRRLTFAGRNRFPMWSRDGQHVVFQSDRDGDQGIFWQRADGTGPVERLTKTEPSTSHVPESWSPATDEFLYSVVTATNSSLWLFSMKDRESTSFGAVQSTQPIGAVFSPDGRWVAYASTETGSRGDVFVQPFPSTGDRYQVSKGGGHHPLWSPDGKELLWDATAGRSDVVRVTTRPSFSFGIPARLPRGSILFSGASTFRPVDMAPVAESLVRSLPSHPNLARPPAKSTSCSTGSAS